MTVPTLCQMTAHGILSSGPLPWEAMDLNAMEKGKRDPKAKERRKPLTDAEKQGRKDRNECLYCGSKDHQLADCPLKPRKGQGNGQRRPNRDA